MEINNQPVSVYPDIRNDNDIPKPEAEDSVNVSNKTLDAKNGITEEQVANLTEKNLQKDEQESTNIEELAQQLQDFIASLNKNVSFSVHKESGKDIISVTDKVTGELIRQIPSEEVLELASRISSAAGLIFKQQV